MQRYFFFGLVVLIAVLFFSCKRKEKPFLKQVDKEIDLKGLNVNLKVYRFDSLFTGLDNANFPAKIRAAEKNAPVMYKFFVENITEAGKIDNPNFYGPRLKEFLLNPYTFELYQDVHKTFPDLKLYEKQLSEAFSRINYFFPKDTIPQFYSMVSNFAYGIVTYEHIFSISLDHYLGKDYKYYPDLYPKYMIRFFEPEYMVTDVIKTYFTQKFPEEAYSGKDMISQMIYHGKMLLFLDMIIPYVPDSIKLCYSQQQLDWAKDNEGEFWNHLINQQLLFESNNEKIDRYFSDGPFTNAYGVPAECPPRIGQWTGWQILRNYVQNNKNATLLSVLLEKDAQKILNLSKYKPKI
jgi:hypothetical protein